MTTPSSNASAPPPSSAPSAEPSRAPPGSPSSSLVGPVSWASSERETAFRHWLAAVVQDHALDGDTVRIASADASARRYLRINGSDGRTSRIIMDAPPQLEDCKPFVRVARLMSEAGVHVPRIWAWDEPTGFMLLDDLGARTLLDVVDREQPSNNLAWFQGAIDELLRWQLASQKDVLAPYDEPLLMRELALFSDWYLDRHRDVRVTGTLRETLEQQYRLIVGRNLSVPSVYVHRDFMPRNLMVPVGFAASMRKTPRLLCLHRAGLMPCIFLGAWACGSIQRFTRDIKFHPIMTVWWAS